jgi:hypothetical protein
MAAHCVTIELVFGVALVQWSLKLPLLALCMIRLQMTSSDLLLYPKIGTMLSAIMVFVLVFDETRRSNKQSRAAIN